MRTCATVLIWLLIATAAQARPVYLTFDDGPGRFTPEILSVLKEHHARATFFMCGTQAKRHPELVRRVARHHRIGNHTWDHPDLWTLGYDAQLRQLRKTQRVLTRLTGSPPTLMRPPYGHENHDTYEVRQRLGLSMVGWDALGNDWEPDRPARKISRQVLRDVDAGGDTILLHDSDCHHPRQDFTGTVRALPRIIEGLRARGHTLRLRPEQTDKRF
jgi:peptidoglycan/xylan/chitin deacetylase (PgdA/CDA1 family)